MKITTRTPENVYVQVGVAESLEMPSFVTHNPQDGSEQHDYSRLTVLVPVNGQDYLIAVEALNPSSDAARHTVKKPRVYNKPVTTVPTSPPSTTPKVTSTVSATTATTGGTQPTIQITTPTSTTQATKRKYTKGPKVGRPTVNTKRDKAIYRDFTSGKMTHSEIAEKYGVSRARSHQIVSRIRKANVSGA